MTKLGFFLAVVFSISSVAMAQSPVRVGFDLSCKTVQLTEDGRRIYDFFRFETKHDGSTVIRNGSQSFFGSPFKDPILLGVHPDSSDYGQIIYKSKHASFKFLSQRLKDLLDNKESPVWFGGDYEQLEGQLEDSFNTYPDFYSLFCNGSVYVY